MAVSQAYIDSLLRRSQEGTLTEEQYNNFQTLLARGDITQQQQAALSGVVPLTDTNTSFENTPQNPQTNQADYSVQAYLDGIGWNPETGMAANGDTAQDIAFNIGLSGIDGGEFGFDESAVRDYFSNMLPTNNPPTGLGMGDDGRQQGVTTNAPVGNDGVDTGGQPDYFDPFEPVWDTGQSIRDDVNPVTGGNQGGYQWNWSDFERGAPSLDGGGGTDPSDYVFNRFVPGQESPWGIPDVEGGNKDFYRNQFMGLLEQEQNFQDKQRASAEQRAFAEANPLERGPTDWSWIEGGLPNVATGGAPPEWGWSDAAGYEQGITNQQLFNNVRDQLTPQTTSWFDNTWQANAGDSPQGTGASQYWGTFDNPNDLIATANGADDVSRINAMQDLANALYTDSNFSTAPAGYASPVDGLGGGRSNFGYQQGGAAFFFNPTTGQMESAAGGGGSTGGSGGGRAV